MSFLKRVLALLALALASPALAQPVLVAADMRPSLSLNGAWHWSVDPLRDGVAGFHGGPPSPTARRWQDNVQAEVQAANPRALFEFDMQRAAVTQLPGGWIGHAPEMRYYQGLVWYQRTFDAALPAPGKRVFLRFGAADYTADVWLNGQKVGTHKGGFTPFAFDVTKLLRAGSNQITIGVDSARTTDDVPGPIVDWETYGGLTRNIDLITVPDTYIDDAWVRLTRDGRIAVSATLAGPAVAGVPVRVAIPTLGLVVEGITDAAGKLDTVRAAPRSLKRWSPESPALYDVRITAGADTLNDRIGFRTVEVRGAQILLNGKPIFLRGICMHEEELGNNPIRAMTPGAARALLSEIKDGLHGNFVRLAHYPHNEVTTRMADELGILVWSEIPTYWRVNWENADTLASARQQLRENIQRDRNRASIVLWSVANETPITDARNSFLRTLIGDVRAMDDTRLVTAALLSKRQGKVITSDDPLIGDLDVMALNNYTGWYSEDLLPDLPSLEWRMPVQKPLIFSEFGADTLAGYRDQTADPHKFSEEFQAEFYRQTLAMAAKVPGLVGMSPWILKDFRSPRRQHSVYQQGYNRKSLISETGQRKLAFDVLAQEYARRAAATK